MGLLQCSNTFPAARLFQKCQPPNPVSPLLVGLGLKVAEDEEEQVVNRN